MKLKFQWTLVLALFIVVSSTIRVTAECDAQFISALKSNYSEATSENIGEILHTATCQKRNSSGSFGLDVYSPKYGEFGLDSSNYSAAEACSRSDYSFFSDNKRRIAYSFLAPEAINALNRCFGGLSLTASKLGNTISVSASYVSTSDGSPSIVRSFTVQGDGGKLICPDTLRVRETIIPGGNTAVCNSPRNENITIVLKTTKGSKTVKIPKTPEITVTAYNWEFFQILAPRKFQCKNQIQTVGSSLNIDPRWEAVKNTVIPGLCLVKYGAGEISIDGKVEIKKDNWDFKVTPEGERFSDTRFIQCMFNGKPVGVVLNTNAEQVSRTDESKRALCAYKYGRG